MTLHHTTWPSLPRATTLGAVLLCLCLQPARADDRTDEECANCHGDKKLLANEKTRKHYIDLETFSHTTHGASGCSSCHTAVTTDHPKDGEKVEKADCDTCHEETATQYKASKHFKSAKCFECHNPHDSKTGESVMATQMNAMCTGCHKRDEQEKKHARWLPQLDFHLAALPCVACHTGSATYITALYIEKRTAGPVGEPLHRAQLEILRPSGQDVTRLVDFNGDGKVSLDELRRWNRGARAQGLRMQTTMLPEETTHSFQVLKNRFDCTFCHVKGPDKKQKAFILFPDETDRTWKRIPVQEGAILDLLAGTPDFYMIGASATRYLAMNLVGAGMVGMGLVFVSGHSFVRLLTRKRRQRRAS